MSTRPTTIVYIDGFNLHKQLLKPKGLQWLNIYSFFTKLRNDDYIKQIYYFTADMTGNEAVGHQAYVSLLEDSNINIQIVRGKHQSQVIECKSTVCTFRGDKKYYRHKEKQTDVNIALQMAVDAIADACQTQILVSGDSDLIPAVRFCQDTKKKKIIIYVPVMPETKYQSQELRDVVGPKHAKNLPIVELAKAQFPDEVITKSGTKIERKKFNW